MQAIIVKFMPATNYRPARWKASCERGTLTEPVRYEGAMKEKEELVTELCRRFAQEDFDERKHPVESNGWLRAKVHGSIPSGEEVFVFVGGDK